MWRLFLWLSVLMWAQFIGLCGRHTFRSWLAGLGAQLLAPAALAFLAHASRINSWKFRDDCLNLISIEHRGGRCPAVA